MLQRGFQKRHAGLTVAAGAGEMRQREGSAWMAGILAQHGFGDLPRLVEPSLLHGPLNGLELGLQRISLLGGAPRIDRLRKCPLPEEQPAQPHPGREVTRLSRNDLPQARNRPHQIACRQSRISLAKRPICPLIDTHTATHNKKCGDLRLRIPDLAFQPSYRV